MRVLLRSLALMFFAVLFLQYGVYAAPTRAPASARTAAGARTGAPTAAPTTAPTSSANQTQQPPSPLPAWFWIGVFALILAVVVLIAIVLLKALPQVNVHSGVTDKELDALRISYGFWLILLGLVLTLAVTILAVSALRPTTTPTTGDLLAVITGVTGVIGTLIAAFFGIQAAGAGRSQAITALSKAAAAEGGLTGTKIDPAYGPREGNTRVSIIGNGFTNSEAVNFGCDPGTNFEFVNDGLVRATSPKAPEKVASVDVSVIYPTATQSNTVVGTFYYYTIDPNHGASKGGTDVTIAGAGFTGVGTVKFGDNEASNFSRKNDELIQMKTPGGDPNTEVPVTLVYQVQSATNRVTVGNFKYDA